MIQEKTVAIMSRDVVVGLYSYTKLGKTKASETHTNNPKSLNMLYWSPLMSAIITRVIGRIIARDTTSTKSYIVPSFTTILHGKRIRHSPYDHRMVSAAASGAMSNHVFAVQVSVQVAIQFLAVQSPVTTAVALQSGILVMRKAQDNFPSSDLFFQSTYI